MKLDDSALETVISLAVGLTNKNDRWTIAGRFKTDGKGNPVILILTKSIQRWRSKNNSIIKRISTNVNKSDSFKTSIECMSGGSKLNVDIFVIEPPLSFGFFEILLSLSSDNGKKLKQILTKTRYDIGINASLGWLKWGFIIEKGVLYYRNRNNQKSGNPIIVENAEQFCSYLLRFNFISGDLRRELILLRENINLLEKRCISDYSDRS